MNVELALARQKPALAYILPSPGHLAPGAHVWHVNIKPVELVAFASTALLLFVPLVELDPSVTLTSAVWFCPGMVTRKYPAMHVQSSMEGDAALDTANAGHNLQSGSRSDR